MRFSQNIRLTWLVVFFVVSACVEPYAPPSVANAPNLLVVDGFFNATDGRVTVNLSRTVSLSDDNPPPREINATVTLEDEQGGSVFLSEVEAGYYVAEDVVSDPALKYRLHVRTAGQDYLSDFVPVTITPPIEKVELDPGSDALSILLTTGDPESKAKYYRWTFTETFEYYVAYQSLWILENQQARPRKPSESIYRCWRTDVAHNILIGSSSAFREDRITDFTITKIPRGSMKIYNRYSIAIQQQALTPEGYAYWQGLYRTTENVGGLFDPLPGQVSGNFYNQNDAKEIVVGFFSASNVSKERIFVTPDDLPQDYPSFYPAFCKLDTLLLEDIPNANPRQLLYSAVYSPMGTDVIGYSLSDDMCLDCRYYGGNTTKPDFWP